MRQALYWWEMVQFSNQLSDSLWDSNRKCRTQCCFHNDGMIIIIFSRTTWNSLGCIPRMNWCRQCKQSFAGTIPSRCSLAKLSMHFLFCRTYCLFWVFWPSDSCVIISWSRESWPFRQNKLGKSKEQVVNDVKELADNMLPTETAFHSIHCMTAVLMHEVLWNSIFAYNGNKFELAGIL